MPGVSLKSLKVSDRRLERQLLKAQCETWSSRRFAVANIILTPQFDKTLATVVILQLALVVYQTDLESSNEDAPLWISAVGFLFLVFYALELAARFFVWRCYFFASKFNIFELILVLLDTMMMLLETSTLPEMTVLRLARSVRILRAGRILTRFPQLFYMVQGLTYAAKSVMWAFGIMFLVMTLWSTVAVQAMHPLVRQMADSGAFGDCSRCANKFQSVMRANLTFFEIAIVGEGWNDVAAPVMDHYPWTILIFVAAFVTLHLGVTNLVFTIAVHTAMEGRENDVQQRLKDKEVAHQKCVKQLSSLFEEIDESHDGYISKDELQHGFESNMEMRDVLQSMDVEEEEIDILFEVLDPHGTGRISPVEFVEQLYKMKTEDSHTLLVFIKSHSHHIRRDVQMQLSLMRDEMLSLLRADHVLLSHISERQNPDAEPPSCHVSEGDPARQNSLKAPNFIEMHEDAFRPHSASTASQQHECSQPQGVSQEPTLIEPCGNADFTQDNSQQSAMPAYDTRGPTVLACVGEDISSQAELKPWEDKDILHESQVELKPWDDIPDEGLRPWDQMVDENLGLMLQDALKKVEAQAEALRWNCKIISSFNESMAELLATGSLLVSKHPLSKSTSVFTSETALPYVWAKRDHEQGDTTCASVCNYF